MLRKKTPLKAIRFKCLECSAGSSGEVANCPIKDCALYEYRFGHIPDVDPMYDNGLSEEEYEKARAAALERFQKKGSTV